MSIPDDFDTFGMTDSNAGLLCIYGYDDEQPYQINLNEIQNMDYYFRKRSGIHFPKGVSFADCTSAQYIFAETSDITFPETTTFENCKDFTDAFYKSTIAPPKNLCLDQATNLAGCFCLNSQTFKYTDWAHHTYPNATNMSDFFAGSTSSMTTVEIHAPKCTTAATFIGGYVGGMSDLKEIYFDAPNLSIVSNYNSHGGNWGFCGNHKAIEKLTIVSNNLQTFGCFVEGCSNLKEVDVDYSHLTSIAGTAFLGTKLNYQSVYRLASTIPTKTASTALGSLGIDKTLKDDPATLEAIQMLRDKNWTVTVQWN